MKQVLTIPGSIDEYIESKDPIKLKFEEDTRGKVPFFKTEVWNSAWVTLMPIIIPAITWFAIFIFDLSTKDIGQLTNNSLTQRHTVLSFSFGVCMLFLCWKSISQHVSISNFWKVQRELIIKEISDKTGPQ